MIGRAIGTATLTVIALMTATFLLMGWTLGGLGGGLGGFDPVFAGIQIIDERLPAISLPLGIEAGLSVGLGVNLARTTGASRLLLALTRTGALPRPLVRIHPRYRSPWVAVATVCTIVAALAFIIVDQLDLLAGLVSFVALTGFLMVNAPVIAQGRAR